MSKRMITLQVPVVTTVDITLAIDAHGAPADAVDEIIDRCNALTAQIQEPVHINTPVETKPAAAPDIKLIDCAHPEVSQQKEAVQPAGYPLEEPEEEQQQEVINNEPVEVLESASYLDANGVVIFVHNGISDNAYGTFRRKENGSLQRVKSPDMPMVDSRNVAQANLNAYAAKHGLELFSGIAPEQSPEPEPAPTEEESIDAAEQDASNPSDPLSDLTDLDAQFAEVPESFEDPIEDNIGTAAPDEGTDEEENSSEEDSEEETPDFTDLDMPEDPFAAGTTAEQEQDVPVTDWDALQVGHHVRRRDVPADKPRPQVLITGFDESDPIAQGTREDGTYTEITKDAFLQFWEIVPNLEQFTTTQQAAADKAVNNGVPDGVAPGALFARKGTESPVYKITEVKPEESKLICSLGPIGFKSFNEKYHVVASATVETFSSKRVFTQFVKLFIEPCTVVHNSVHPVRKRFSFYCEAIF